MKSSIRKSIMEDVSKYCHLSEEHDYMELTEWSNGEGYDIALSAHGESQKFSLTNGEMDLLFVLSKMIYVKGE